jgi:hypothetical protein
MKEKLTKQEVAEAKREARSFAQMKKKFRKAIIEEVDKKEGTEAKKFIANRLEIL